MTDTYRIGLKNCVFFARHGVLQEEAQLGQSFHVDVDMDILASDVLATDTYENTVDYGAVHACVEQIVTKQRFNLIEALAYRVGEELCIRFPAIKRVVVTIRKPSAPIPGVFDHAEVIVEYVPG